MGNIADKNEFKNYSYKHNCASSIIIIIIIAHIYCCFISKRRRAHSPNLEVIFIKCVYKFNQIYCGWNFT